jgi:hypothetical protein
VAVMDIGCRDAGAVDQATGASHADVKIHPKVPLGSINAQNSAHGIRVSIRDRHSALRVARLCFSNPPDTASVVCFILLPLA